MMNMRSRNRLATPLLLGLLLIPWPLISQVAAQLPYRDVRLPIESRVRDLLGRMTLDEKFWQLFMIPGDLDNPANDFSKGIFGLQIGSPASSAENGDSAH